MLPKRPKIAQMVSKVAQMRPKLAQMVPKMAQMVSKAGLSGIGIDMYRDTAAVHI